MNRLGSAISTMFRLPQTWLLMLGMGLIFMSVGWEPFVDIALYALWRLAH
jgi:hypothetical protein